MTTPVETKDKFEGGSTRSTLGLLFRLIPAEAIFALARRLTLGAQKHGERNWEQGGEEFRRAAIDHLMKHLLDYMDNGNAAEPNTDAIIANAAFLCHFEKKLPYRPRG